MRRATVVLAAVGVAVATRASAHHGVAAVGVGGMEGPGAALDTTAALPLAQGRALVLARTELVDFQDRPVDEPQKEWSSFTTLLAGYGLRPWLTAYVLAPYAVKVQDVLGTSAGFADPSVMVAFSFKRDDGWSLVPEKESLDDLEDWHFQLWGSTTVALGSTSRRDSNGDFFEPEMQTGFGAPSAAVGFAALKQLGRDLTWLGEASWQGFSPHQYETTRHQFGAETRVNTALSWRALVSGATRLDAIAELNGLHLQRDRQRGEQGAMEPLRASGGAVLYVSAGVRLQRGPFGASLGLKLPALTDLNEVREQQGSEGLERFRASASAGFAFGP